MEDVNLFQLEFSNKIAFPISQTSPIQQTTAAAATAAAQLIDTIQ